MTVPQPLVGFAITLVVGIPVAYYVGFWLSCRFTARPCPACGEKWMTTVTGEYDGVEDWKCQPCGHAWGHNLDKRCHCNQGHFHARGCPLRGEIRPHTERTRAR